MARKTFNALQVRYDESLRHGSRTRLDRKEIKQEFTEALEAEGGDVQINRDAEVLIDPQFYPSLHGICADLLSTISSEARRLSIQTNRGVPLDKRDTAILGQVTRSFRDINAIQESIKNRNLLESLDDEKLRTLVTEIMGALPEHTDG